MRRPLSRRRLVPNIVHESTNRGQYDSSSSLYHQLEKASTIDTCDNDNPRVELQQRELTRNSFFVAIR